jgi:O-antigen/teichoic acid export membrane protein
MKLSYKIVSTVLIQSLGVLAVFLITLIVTNKYGILAQGYYSYSRSTIELLATIGTFGFAQSFVYAINNKIITVKWAVIFSINYISVILFLSLTFILFQLLFANNVNINYSLVIVFASVSLAFHGLIRAIALTKYSSIIFNSITILPSVLMLLSMALIQVNEHQQLVLCIAISNVAAAFLSTTIFHKEIFSGNIFNLNTFLGQRNRKKIIFIGKYGFWTFVQPFLSQFSLTFCYFVLQKKSHGDYMSGHFSIAMLFLSFAILPLNMLIPILFDYWSKCGIKQLQKTYKRLSFAGLVLSISIGVFILFSSGSLSSFLDIHYQKYNYTFSVIQILLCGVYPCYQNRILSALMLAQNNPVAICIASFLRVIAIAISFMLGLSDSAVAVGWAWNFGEIFSMLYLMFIACQKYNQSVYDVVGIYNFR